MGGRAGPTGGGHLAGRCLHEVAEKVADWLAAGTRFVYVVDPRRQTVTIHSARHGMQGLAVQDMWEAERVVPGWRLLVADIFRA